jgi:ATP-dependent 26S proteasome regulatory subunit
MSDKEKVEKPKPPAGYYPPCKADEEIKHLIAARYTLLYVVSWEEQRVIDAIQGICDLEDVNLSGAQVWDSMYGLRTAKGFPVDGGEVMKNPEDVLDHIIKTAETSKKLVTQAKESRGPVYVLCDLYRYLMTTGENGFTPELERKLRVLSTSLRSSSVTVVIISPELHLPTSLQKCVTVIDYPLPGPEHLEVSVEQAKAVLTKKGKMNKGEPKDQHAVVRALLGLTVSEAEDAIAKAAIVTKRMDIPTLLELKRQIIRKGQVLDYIYTDANMGQVGGFAGVKQFLQRRKPSLTSPRAKEYGLPPLKGIFLLGVQGSGKSLCAKAVANELQVPLLKLDMGRMFGSLVGESEGTMRRALQIAESVAPAVMLVDEMDKALAGAQGPNGDSGTTKRVIASLLDWMQEKTAPVFVIGCANSIDGLPAALLRKGRFDEAFFVDLPVADERSAIFDIHISKRGRDPAKFDIPKLVATTDTFSGAEIEATIVDAMFTAFSEGEREFTTADIEGSISTCVPLARTMKEELDELRERARGKMKKASELSSFAVAAPASRFDL